MTDLPKISIVTPSLNQGEYIERCIRSVVEQDYPNIEYIIMDGGSTDCTVDIIKKYENQITHWQSAPDSGQSSAINDGLRKTTGEIVAYINTDDWYLPGAFTTAADAIIKSGKSWCAGIGVNVDPETNAESEWPPVAPLENRARMVAIPWGVHQSGCFWKRELMDECGYFREDLHYVLDSEYWIRLVLMGYEPEIIQERLAMRLVQSQSKTAVDRPKFVEEQMRFLDIFRELIPQEYLSESEFLFRWKSFWLATHAKKFPQAFARLINMCLHNPVWFCREIVGKAFG